MSEGCADVQNTGDNTRHRTRQPRNDDADKGNNKMNDDLIGARLANYEIQSALGRGGMARVYKAWDTTLKRAVAIKVIEPSLSAEAHYRERFEREAQAIAALEHANIVPVYYFGKTQNLYYLAMKFIEGEDLGTLMNRYAVAGEYLPADDILHIVRGVVSALDYAHSRGVIHRDVKPSNIMVDRDGHPYLADFGLALNLSQGTVGNVLGTPHYVAPEQARNSADAILQSDLYSLGIVLYELFTGVVPFDDPSPTAVALQHLMNEPPAPRALNPEITPGLESVILKAMAKRPEERYQSGAEMVTALEEALKAQAHEVVDAPTLPPLPPGFAPPTPRRQSMRPVASEVRTSLAQRESLSAQSAVRRSTPADAHQSAQRSATPKSQTTNYLPLMLFGGVILGIVLIVAIAALSLNNRSTVAALPTLQPSETPLPPTETPAGPTENIPTVSPVVEVAAVEDKPGETPSPESLTETPVPSSGTTVPPSPSPEAPTETSIPPTETPAGPTPVPPGWLPVRFIYNADAFYWMNDSDRTISSRVIVFERVDGSQRFEGSRFAFYSMERGRCMQIMFADVARTGCPENRRPNAFFTPTRTQNVDFWTGGSGQFRVLWGGVEIAVCEISDGQCTAFVPPG
jgi:serine/threonine protein kinase